MLYIYTRANKAPPPPNSALLTMLEWILLGSWSVLTVVSIFRLKSLEGQSPLRIERWKWANLLIIFGILQTLTILINHTIVPDILIKDTSTNSFLKVLMEVSSTGYFLVLLQFGGAGWGGIRRSLSRVEWRTILGLAVFGTLAELVFQPEEMADLVPVGVVRITLFGTILGRSIVQSGQMATFRKIAGDRAARYGAKIWSQVVVIGMCILFIVQEALIIFLATSKREDPGRLCLISRQSCAISCFLLFSLLNILKLLE